MEKIQNIPIEFLTNFLPFTQIAVVSWKYQLLKKLKKCEDFFGYFPYGEKVRIYKEVANSNCIDWRTVERFATSKGFKEYYNNLK